MMTTNKVESNEAFEKFYATITPAVPQAGYEDITMDAAYLSWQAASHIYEQEIAELKEELSILKPHPKCDTSCLLACSMEADAFEHEYNRGIALKAQVNQLREDLVRLREDRKLWKVSGICGQDSYAGLPPAMRIIDEALASTPAQSLQAHDNKLIEKAVSICQRKSDDYKSLAISCDEIKDHVGHDICIHKQAVASSIGNAIRALKEVK